MRLKKFWKIFRKSEEFWKILRTNGKRNSTLKL